MFFDIDVKGGEYFVAKDDKQSVIKSATSIQNLNASINAKGGDCWHCDRYCDHMEIDHIVMWFSLMETHNFQAYDPTTRRIDKQRSEFNQALQSSMQAN